MTLVIVNRELQLFLCNDSGSKEQVKMYIARLSLICLIAFAFMVGCGMKAEQAEMTEASTGTLTDALDGAAMKSETAADDTAEAAIEEVTVNVTGRT